MRGVTLTMVYNNSYYRPASLTDRLRLKFGERTANAIYRANSRGGSDVADGTVSGEVLSFFGRPADTRTGDRAIPSARKAVNRRTHDNAQRMQVPARVRTQGARPVQQTRPAQNTRPAGQNVRRDARTAASKTVEKRINGYGKAYQAGDRVKAITSSVRIPRAERYEKRQVPTEALKRGRAGVPGSRHVTVKSGVAVEDKNIFVRVKEFLKDVHKAEHRVKKAPLPIAYASLVTVCAVMAMVMIFSYSQVSECEGMIGNMNSRYNELSETAAKLELQLETRDDIRKIENIAVDYIGMVNSDVAQTKFVSVSADDRVEILKTETEEEEGVFSALLSAIGEGIGKFSEYFN